MKNPLSAIARLAVGMMGAGPFDQHANSPGSGDKPAFINKTSASEEQLQEQWNLAQTQIAQVGFNLKTFADQPAHGPDPRAMDIRPHGVTVISVPDVPISELVKSDRRWERHHDPSGAIFRDGRTASSCIDVNANTVYVAASAVPGACQHEFEVIILNALGYDVRYVLNALGYDVRSM